MVLLMKIVPKQIQIPHIDVDYSHRDENNIPDDEFIFEAVALREGSW